MSPPAKLSENLESYEQIQNELEMDHNGEWVVIYDKEVKAFFSEPSEATEFAVGNFGRGPYLIRRIGESSLSLPASVVYQTWEPAHAHSG